MGKKRKFDSIRFKLFTMLCISTMSIVFIIVIINNIVLETFYTCSKTEKAKTISKEINQFYNNVVQYDINSELRQIEIQNNMDILIEDDNEDIIYSGNKEMIGVVIKTKKSKSALTIYTNDNTIIKKFEDNNKCLMLIRNLDNGNTLYIRIPITPNKESVKISNESLGLVAVLMILISGGISSYISRKFTDPIVQLNNITQKMSKLDFSKRYEETRTNDEINTLGRNINTMSDKLEATIGQLRKNNNQLEKDIEEKSKIDEMRKQFISDVSHELKTPIALIQGYAEGLVENVNNDEKSRKFYAEVIIDEANKMDTMVKQLLELMKLEYQERKMEDSEFDLRELINEELKRESKILKENNITVEFDDTEKINVYASQQYIEQVVNNYLTNAIKHCEERAGEKKITIRTEKVSEQKLRLFIYNTGEKIAEEDLPKIWGRFYKADTSRNREKGGTGIGLAIVRAIMNHYHNDYGVKNYENGVEFYCDINTKK